MRGRRGGWGDDHRPGGGGADEDGVTCSAAGGAVCPASPTVAQIEGGLAIPTLPSGGSVTFTHHGDGDGDVGQREQHGDGGAAERDDGSDAGEQQRDGHGHGDAGHDRRPRLG